MKLVTVFEREDLLKLQPGIIIEMWRNVMQSGSKKRKYKEEFTVSERGHITRQYKIYQTWYYQTGIPDTHKMPIHIYQLMQRAVHFFATV